MKFLLRGILFIVFGLLQLQTNAFGTPEKKDTPNIQNETTIKKHSPSKATVYAAVLPGLGQVYNKKYWKVPFVWGGFAGFIYSVNYFNVKYVNEKRAYYDLFDNNPNTKSYETTFPNIDDPYYKDTKQYSTYKTKFITQIEADGRKRDLLTIGTIGFYLLTVLDANVGAHFIDFDISEDLTFNFKPIMIEPITNSPILGGQITFTF